MMWMKTKKTRKNMKKLGKAFKKEIETINGGEKVEYGKDLKKIRMMIWCLINL